MPPKDKVNPGEFIRQVRTESEQGRVGPRGEETITDRDLRRHRDNVLLALFFLGIDSAPFGAVVKWLLTLASDRRRSETQIQDRTMASRWYIIHAYSGFENKVREAILSEAERLGLSDGVEEVEVPTETITEIKRGKKVQTERKFMPGYVLAKLKMNDDIYHLVKNTPESDSGFLGNNNKPQADFRDGRPPAISAASRRPKSAPEEGNPASITRSAIQVKVLDGPFASFNGVVEELDFDKGKVKVSVSIFGRATPVELDFEQVELVK